MFHQQHTRWNQWAVFFFGSLASIFVIGDRLEGVIPCWIPSLVACIVSLMWIFVASSIRASTWAWRETVLKLENLDERQRKTAKVFSIQERKFHEFKHWKDLRKTLIFWRHDTRTSVTRILTLFGILSFVLFFLLFLSSVTSCYK